MKAHRLLVLLEKELKQGARSFFFFFAILAPLAISLVISLLFGTLFSDKPSFGVADEGRSELVARLAATGVLILKDFNSEGELKLAVETGAVDMGMIVPANFDTRLQSGELIETDAYVWGGSLLRHRAVIGTTLVALLREMVGQTAPIDIQTVIVGEALNIPWEDRLLPLIVLLAVVLGGFMIPASSLVDEKQKRTLTALTVAPPTFGEVFLAKGFVGFLVSLLMGLIILTINRAFGSQPGLLILTLALGAVLSASFGVLLGALIGDLNTLFAVTKSLGIVLYAPGLIALFPGIPAWIAKIFPTNYIIEPVIEISQRGAGWGEVAPDLLILSGLCALTIGAVAWAGRRMALQAT